jgi:hypothetical protein
VQIDQSAGQDHVEVVPPSPAIAGLQPLKTIRSRWPAIIGAAVTLAMVAGLAHELLNAGLGGLERATPRNPMFYIAFAALYLVPPLADYLIFRRLWGILRLGARTGAAGRGTVRGGEGRVDPVGDRRQYRDAGDDRHRAAGRPGPHSP